MFEQHPPIIGQRHIDLRCRVEIAVERAAQILLPRKISAVADPDRQRGRPQLPPDLDTLDVVLDRLLACRLQRRSERAGIVAIGLPRLVLKRVAVNRIEPEAKARSFFAQRGIIADLVHGKWGETRGVTVESWLTTAQSASFSWIFVGSPAIGNFAKRVPPRPDPQLGTATEKLATLALIESISKPRRFN